MRIDRRHLLATAAMLAATALLPGSPSAQPSSFATFIQQLGDDAIALLEQKGITPSEAENNVRRLLRTGFAVPQIGRFVMGRYWRDMTASQRDQYLGLFEDYIVKTYASKLSLYSGVRFQVTGERPDGDGAVVNTEVRTPDGTPLNVQWRMRSVKDQPQIIDVVIEGVSMALTQQSEFASVIRQNGGSIDALVDELRRKVDALG